MLFNAVAINFPISTFFKISPIMQSVHSLAGAHAGRCRFFASNNPKESRWKSPDQEIEAARANRPKIKGSFFKIFNTRGKIANAFDRTSA